MRIVALYCFAPVADCAALRAKLTASCRKADVRGTLLIAPEGINGTIAGADSAVEAVLTQIRALPGFATPALRESRADAPPFARLKVRLKREIVTMGFPDLDPAAAGTHVDPHDWNALIADPDTVLIDTRNGYEIALGTFDRAIDPETRHFGEFPGWFRARRDALLEGPGRRRVAMFCTGGIRCEKATAFLKGEGVEEVYHLRGGILNYLEQMPVEESRWRGDCFVFDDRVSVAHDLTPRPYRLCPGCQRDLDVLGEGCSRCSGDG